MKAIHRAHLDAVRQFALNTAFKNNKGHESGSNSKNGQLTLCEVQLRIKHKSNNS